jgi:hypothetical protein
MTEQRDQRDELVECHERTWSDAPPHAGMIRIRAFRGHRSSSHGTTFHTVEVELPATVAEAAASIVEVLSRTFGDVTTERR